MSGCGRHARSGTYSPLRPPQAGGMWADLRSAVRAGGRFDRPMILRIALARARAERDHFLRMGLPQPWPILLAHELRLTWQVAKAAMDNLVAERIRARLDPPERAARTLELRADLAATAIPPDPSGAAVLRARAMRIRESIR
jgi:hypothetical protein